MLEASTQGRFNSSAQWLLGSLGPVGQAMSTGLGWINSAGAKVTSLMADETNQTGVGQSTYGPDFSGYRSGGHKRESQPDGADPHPEQTDGDPTNPPHQSLSKPVNPARERPCRRAGRGGTGTGPGSAGAAAGAIPPVAV